MIHQILRVIGVVGGHVLLSIVQLLKDYTEGVQYRRGVGGGDGNRRLDGGPGEGGMVVDGSGEASGPEGEMMEELEQESVTAGLYRGIMSPATRRM